MTWKYWILTLQHIYQLSSLPFYQNDPFDRLLLSQSEVENMPIISADSQFKHYDDAIIIW